MAAGPPADPGAQELALHPRRDRRAPGAEPAVPPGARHRRIHRLGRDPRLAARPPARHPCDPRRAHPAPRPHRVPQLARVAAHRLPHRRRGDLPAQGPAQPAAAHRPARPGAGDRHQPAARAAPVRTREAALRRRRRQGLLRRSRVPRPRPRRGAPGGAPRPGAGTPRGRGQPSGRRPGRWIRVGSRCRSRSRRDASGQCRPSRRYGRRQRSPRQRPRKPSRRCGRPC